MENRTWTNEEISDLIFHIEETSKSLNQIYKEIFEPQGKHSWDAVRNKFRYLVKTKKIKRNQLTDGKEPTCIYYHIGV